MIVRHNYVKLKVFFLSVYLKFDKTPFLCTFNVSIA